MRQFALAAFIAGLLPFNANAESKTGDTFGDWVIECHQATPEKVDTNTCVLTQTVVDKDKKLKLLKIIMGQGKDDAFITALVPLGISISAGVSITLDQNKSFPLILKTCIPQGCIAATKLDSKLLKAIKSGDKISVSFTMKPAEKPIAVGGSLKGVHEGLKAINLYLPCFVAAISKAVKPPHVAARLRRLPGAHDERDLYAFTRMQISSASRKTKTLLQSCNQC